MQPTSLKVLVAMFAVVGPLNAAEPKNPPAKVEMIQGTSVSRVILTERAANRLGIQTTEVREEPLVRKRLVSGETLMSEPILATVGSAETAVVARNMPEEPVLQVVVRPIGDLDRTARTRPVRVLPLTVDQMYTGWPADPAALTVFESVKDLDTPMIYVLRDVPPGVRVPARVLVELALSEGAAARKVVPFAAVLYDKTGATWVYTRSEPLVFVRQPIIVDYIDGELAVLSEGPPVGTAIVSVGVDELFGTEFKIGK
jgi:hypothetical protein